MSLRFLVFLSRPLFSPSVPRFFSFWAAVCCIHSSSSVKLFVESRRAYLVNVVIGVQRRMRAIYEFRLSMYGSCSRSYSRTGLLTHQGVTSQRQYVPENVAPKCSRCGLRWCAADVMRTRYRVLHTAVLLFDTYCSRVRQPRSRRRRSRGAPESRFTTGHPEAGIAPKNENESTTTTKGLGCYHTYYCNYA